MPDPSPRSVTELNCKPAGPVFPSPADWRDQVLYEIMIDRFDDGRGDRPAYDPAHADRNRDPKAGNGFVGGTLRGVTARLDYIQGLGATAIWLTPPLKNRTNDPGSYHGYAVQNYLEVDPRFGTTADFQDLVRQAHDRGMYVVMDIVMEHAGDVWTYAGGDKTWDDGKRFEFGSWRRGADGQPLVADPGPDDAVWPVEFQTPGAFNRMGAMRDVGRAREPESTHGDFMSLKKLDLEDAGVLSAVIAVYKHWIATVDVDGFRIDAFRHAHPPAAAAFCNAVREYAARIGKQNFFMVGEVAASSEETTKFVGSNVPLADEKLHSRYPLLEAVLDFPLYQALPQLLLGTGGPRPVLDRFAFLQRYYRDPGQAGRYYVTFTENHDGGADGNHHRLLHGNNDDRLAVLAAGFLLTSIGIPCLYYGTEQGFDGGGDTPEDIREAMFGGRWGAFGTTEHHFFNPDHAIYKGIAKIAAARRQRPALRYGRQFFRDISGDGVHFGPTENAGATLAYSRVLDVSEAVVALNLSADDRADGVMVDAALTPPGTELRDMLGNVPAATVERSPDGHPFVRVPLKGRTMAVLVSAGELEC